MEEVVSEGIIDKGLDKLHAFANKREDRRVTEDIANDAKAEGIPAREVAALAYGREHDMAESAMDDGDRPARDARETVLDSDPELAAGEDSTDGRQ